MDDLLGQAFIYLVAAVAAVPIAKRFGLGSVLGYLLAGVLIGPFVLGLVGQEGHSVMHFAELGVVMMLFLVGLELRPSLLWEMRKPIVGLGGAQVLGTAAVVMALAMGFGIAWKPALALGMIVAMSSTAIVLQSLAEKALSKTAGGQAAFSVLLFQDVAVIGILAIFPLLGTGAGVVEEGPARPGWLQALMVVTAVAAIVVAGRFVVRPFFRWLAETRLREIFTAAALLLVVGIALLMHVVGLSPALGTFLAGVVLAESEYRHELESDIEPFKGLLLGLFFISVGAQIDFAYVGEHPMTLLVLVLGLMTVKLGVLYALGRAFSLDRSARWLLALGLAQVGEFAFVLISFATRGRIFGEDLATPLVAAVAMSMMITPLLFLLLERVILPRAAAGGETRPHDEIGHAANPVVMAGFGRFGQVVGRFLRANGVGMTVLDLDPEMVDVLRRLDLKVHYGDAARPELLYAAGCAQAKLFVLAVDDAEVSREIALTVRKHFPNLPILARARDRVHYYELRKIGIEKIYRETFGSALEVGVDAMRALGTRAHTARRRAQMWRNLDERAIEHLATLWGQDEASFFDAAKKALTGTEALMRTETSRSVEERDAAWDNEARRADVQERLAEQSTRAEAEREDA